MSTDAIGGAGFPMDDPVTAACTLRLDGRVAIVTGASSGIGLAAARLLARRGARVALLARGDHAVEAARQVSDECGTQAIALSCDMGDPAAVEQAMEDTVARLGTPGIIVNNAAMMDHVPLDRLGVDDWLRHLHVNLIGPFVLIRQAFHRMQPGGAVVNVSSVHAFMAQPNAAAYAATKAAMLSLTRSAAIEGRPRGIRVNAVVPGAIDTPMLWSNPAVKSGAEKLDPADVGQPEDVAETIAFLASDAARFVTGVAMPVDGGRLAKL